MNFLLRGGYVKDLRQLPSFCTDVSYTIAKFVFANEWGLSLGGKYWCWILCRFGSSNSLQVVNG